MHDYKFCWTCTISIALILMGIAGEVWVLAQLF